MGFYRKPTRDYFSKLPSTWLPYKYNADLDALVDHYTDVPTYYTNIHPACETNKNRNDHCTTFSFSLDVWCFNPCNYKYPVKKSCTCQNQEQAVLIMRGLCEDTLLDIFYVMVNDLITGQLVLEGITGTTLSYDTISFRWTVAVIGQKVSGISIQTHESFMLGTSTWGLY